MAVGVVEIRKTDRRVGSDRQHPIWEVVLDGESVGRCWRREVGTSGYYGAWALHPRGFAQQWSDSREACVYQLVEIAKRRKARADGVA